MQLRPFHVVAACVLSALASTLLSVWASSYLAQRYHRALSAQIENALSKTASTKFKEGMQEMCLDQLTRTCAFQWGKPCVARTTRKPYE